MLLELQVTKLTSVVLYELPWFSHLKRPLTKTQEARAPWCGQQLSKAFMVLASVLIKSIPASRTLLKPEISANLPKFLCAKLTNTLLPSIKKPSSLNKAETRLNSFSSSDVAGTTDSSSSWQELNSAICAIVRAGQRCWMKFLRFIAAINNLFRKK